MKTDGAGCAAAGVCGAHAPVADRLQWRRRFLQAAFFALFILAPPLDLLRFDLRLGHLIVLGQPWGLGLEALLADEVSGTQAAFNLMVRGLLPLLALAFTLGWVAWRWGRLYCGWLCPHFSVVEFINGLMRRAIGKLSLWDRRGVPERQPDGRVIPVRPGLRWLLPFTVVGFGLLWATVLLTYLWNPAEVYAGLATLSLPRNQAIFLTAATVVFSLEFLLARHLFCRFFCAVGVFQSLLWMPNRRAQVVGFDRERARRCSTCDDACEHACPMRLKPRTIKRHMFTCVQCARCMQACDAVQRHQGGTTPLLQWVEGACALDVSAREFGRHPTVPGRCYRR